LDCERRLRRSGQHWKYSDSQSEGHRCQQAMHFSPPQCGRVKSLEQRIPKLGRFLCAGIVYSDFGAKQFRKAGGCVTQQRYVETPLRSSRDSTQQNSTSNALNLNTDRD